MPVLEAEQPQVFANELVISLSELPQDVETYSAAERMKQAAEIGSVAVRGAEVASSSVYANLQEAIAAAEQGDEQAEAFVKANIRSDVVERTIKAGIIMKTKLHQTIEGKIIQHGQTLEDVHLNSLAFASGGGMEARTMAETRNSIRLQQCLDDGVLEDYYFVVISRYTDTLSDVAANKAGFFVPTKTMSVQATTVENGVITMESAYAAGVATEGAERHDAQAVGLFGDKIGVDLRKTDAATIDTALLIHKSQMIHGVVDVIESLDTCAEETLDNGQQIFFGQAKEKKNYVAYVKECEQTVANFDEKIELIYQDLLLSRPQIHTPQDATEMLNKLSGKHMIDYAISDKDIDARVFGAASGEHIERARMLHQQGLHEEAEAHRDEAVELDDSGSCPAGSRNVQNSGDSNDSGEGSTKRWVGCPLCGDKKAFFGDPCATAMKCGTCKSEAKNGVVTDRRKETAMAKASEKAAKEKQAQKAKQAQEITNRPPTKESFTIPVSPPAPVQRAAQPQP